MSRKWNLYQLGAKMICNCVESGGKDVLVTIIDWFDTEKAPAVYRCRKEDGTEIYCTHDELKPPRT